MAKMRKRLDKMHDKRFTLIEMLVVVAIISIMALLLLPLLSQSQNKARKARCLSNLGQIGVATKIYVDENAYYPSTYREVPGGGIQYWCGFFQGGSMDMDRSPMKDYLKSSSVLTCPSFGHFASLDPSKDATSSYGLNAEFIGGSPDPNENPTEDDILKKSKPAKLLDIKSPDKILTHMDSAIVSMGNITESLFFWPRFSFVTSLEHEARTHFRHGRVAVGVFCDGHVNDSIQPDAISDEINRIGWPENNMCAR